MKRYDIEKLYKSIIKERLKQHGFVFRELYILIVLLIFFVIRSHLIVGQLNCIFQQKNSLFVESNKHLSAITDCGLFSHKDIQFFSTQVLTLTSIRLHKEQV